MTMRMIEDQKGTMDGAVVAAFRDQHLRLLSDVREACPPGQAETAEAIELVRTLRVVARAYIRESVGMDGSAVDLDQFIAAVTA
ncbi:MAG: hypothetical protein ABR598_03085 [Candidatus Dormibacteria bacterium]